MDVDSFVCAVDVARFFFPARRLLPLRLFSPRELIPFPALPLRDRALPESLPFPFPELWSLSSMYSCQRITRSRSSSLMLENQSSRYCSSFCVLVGAFIFFFFPEFLPAAPLPRTPSGVTYPRCVLLDGSARRRARIRPAMPDCDNAPLPQRLILSRTTPSPIPSASPSPSLSPQSPPSLPPFTHTVLHNNPTYIHTERHYTRFTQRPHFHSCTSSTPPSLARASPPRLFLKIQQQREKEVLKNQQEREGLIQNPARERRTYSKSSKRG